MTAHPSVRDKDVRARRRCWAMGSPSRPGTPADLQAAVAADIHYWGSIAKRVGARND